MCALLRAELINPLERDLGVRRERRRGRGVDSLFAERTLTAGAIPTFAPRLVLQVRLLEELRGRLDAPRVDPLRVLAAERGHRLECRLASVCDAPGLILATEAEHRMEGEGAA